MAEFSCPDAMAEGICAKMIPKVLASGPIFPGGEVREHKSDEFMELIRLPANN